MFAFVTGCQAKNYLQDSDYSLAHFTADARPLRHTEPDNAGPLSHTEPPAQATKTFLGGHQLHVLLKILQFACQIPPLKFGQIFILFFNLQGAVPRKGNTKPPPILTVSRHPLQTATPGAPWTLPAQRKRTRKTSSSWNTRAASSESSDSEPEDTSSQNLRMGWSERVTRVDTQFL